MPQDIKSIKREESAPNEESQQEADELLTPKRVAAKLQISTAMVYKMVREGELEALHIGRLVRIRPESYERLLDKLAETAR